MARGPRLPLPLPLPLLLLVVPWLLLLSLLSCGCSPSNNSSRVVPSSQSRSFWDQITANNEQGKSGSSSDHGDDSIFGPAEAPHRQDGSRPGSTQRASSASLQDVLESRKARRNLECRPDFCYRMQTTSGSASSGSSSSSSSSSRVGTTRVCGTDGKTYDSRCMLQFLRRCHGQKVRVKHLGACGAPLPGEDEAIAGGSGGGGGNRRRLSSGRGRCQDMRLAALDKSSSGRQVIYVPQCGRHGKFRRVQCNYQLKYCFCVRRRSGKPLPGSGVQLPRRPNCRGGRRRKKQQQSRQQQQQRLAQQGGNNRQDNRRRGRRRKGGSRGSGRKNRCSSRQRAQFNRNILKQFEIEFNASIAFRAGGVLKPRREINGLSIRGVDLERSALLQQPERRSAEWKFTELDANSNGQLSYRETKALRKVTKANIKPKGCARRFFSTCDLNANKQLERAEWILCFGLENSAPVTMMSAPSAGVSGAMSRSSGGIAAPLVAAVTASPASSFDGDSYTVDSGQPAIAGGSTSSKGSLMELVSRRRKRKRTRKARPFAHKSCPLAREEAQEKNRQLSQLSAATSDGRSLTSASQSGRVFVPECSADGKYAKRQCHTSGGSEGDRKVTTTSLCFCMDPDSGRVLKGGSGSGATLDCESAHIRARATVSAGFRGCSQPLLRQFATQLTALLVQETRDAWRPEDGHLSVEARSLKLRFQRADVNRDGRLDRKEQRWWRREIKARWKAGGSSAPAERRRTRKCAANFLRFCNANGDQFVTLAELQACLGLPSTA